MRSCGEREILTALQSAQADARPYRLTAPMDVFFGCGAFSRKDVGQTLNGWPPIEAQWLLQWGQKTPREPRYLSI
jgi:hypothetical protein